MLTRIRLRSGATPSGPALDWSPSTATVVVGPNHSGKSLLLQEIFQGVGNRARQGNKIVDLINWESLSPSELFACLEKHVTHQPGEGRWILTTPNGSVQVSSLDELRKSFTTPLPESHDLHRYVASLLVTKLDGKTRLDLLKPSDSEDLKKTTKTVLATLLQDDLKRSRLRKMVYKGIRAYPVVDPTGMRQFLCRLSSREPDPVTEEKGIDDRACEFHRHAIPINDASDGTRAYCGLLAAAIAAKARLVLVDEPEAFLHPPLADLLGRQFVQTIHEGGGKLIAATHSAHFLRGCISSGHPVTVLRLGYDNGRASARALPASQVTTVMRDPLLRSTRVVDSLFARAAVVTEGDSDRAFYEEINVRLHMAGEAGVYDAVFLNAQNKQTVARIVGLLRSMGVAAAAVVDLDILKQNDLTELLRQCAVPSTLLPGLGVTRGKLLEAFTSKGLDPKHDGISSLEPHDQAACKHFCTSLAPYGVFIVPVGAVEGWLGGLEAAGNKTGWLVDVFGKMGVDPDNQEYVRPGSGDVWEFVRSVGTWCSTWVAPA